MLRDYRPQYLDRRDAGRRLAGALHDLTGRADVVVLGLPRGGVPVASEIAQALGAPLDIFVVRTICVPGDTEISLGAVASGDIRVLDRPVIEGLALPWSAVAQATQVAQRKLHEDEQILRNGRRPLSLAHRIVVLVDDGLANGSLLRVAVQAVRTLKPAEVIVAVPIASAAARDDLCVLADRVVCPLVPSSFRSVGEWYADFAPTSDDDVRALLGLLAPVALRGLRGPRGLAPA